MRSRVSSFVVKLAKRRGVGHTPAVRLRNSLLVCLAILTCPDLVRAEFRLLSLEVRPRVYSNVVVLGANETDLYFRHDRGLMNVKLAHLSPELQKQFDYDPDKAAAAEKQKTEDEQRYAESIAKAVEAETVQRIRGPATLGDDSLADPLADKSLLNQPAPELAVEKWIGEKPSQKGKFTIIFFWATSSAPCRRAIPDLNAYHRKFGRNLVIIAVGPGNEAQLAQMTEPKIEFYTATDSTNKLASLAGVTSIPQILLIDPKNIVRYQGHPAAVNENILTNLFAKFAVD